MLTKRESSGAISFVQGLRSPEFNADSKRSNNSHLRPFSDDWFLSKFDYLPNALDFWFHASLCVLSE